MNEVIAVAIRFLSSTLLYKPTHEPGFPELGRYVTGGLVVILAYAVLHPGDREGLRRLWLALAAAGLGVAAARLWGLLQE